jgi:hypothetical protein
MTAPGLNSNVISSHHTLARPARDEGLPHVSRCLDCGNWRRKFLSGSV